MTLPARDGRRGQSRAKAPARAPRAKGPAKPAALPSPAAADREGPLRDALLALRRSHEELKQAQLQLIQAAKLESIGRLAAGVAHEVKNPLAIIRAGTDYLLHAMPQEQSETRTVIEDIQNAVARANNVIGGLLDFAASTALTTAVEGLNDVIEASLRLVQHALTREHIVLVRELADDLPPLMLDRTKIEQVFVNLFINAIDAMQAGGTLTVRTSRHQLTAHERDVGARHTDPFRIGQTVVVAEVDDDGTGISDGHLTRVFDPFFTTKQAGKGTGLGLAVCKSIVALHGGTLSIENRTQGGARARVLFKSVRNA